MDRILHFVLYFYVLCLIFQVINTDCIESTPVSNGTCPHSRKPEQEPPVTPAQPQPPTQAVKTLPQSQETPKRTSVGIPQAFCSSGPQINKGLPVSAGLTQSPHPLRPKAHTMGEDQNTPSSSLSTHTHTYLGGNGLTIVFLNAGV